MWTCDKVYILTAQTFVHASLTIEAGTLIRGTSASVLVIEKDGRLNVLGTPEDPVVMTSNFDTPSAGDWAGLMLVGDAPTNLGAPGIVEGLVDPVTYGGDDVDHNCGDIRYLRIEYAGWELADGTRVQWHHLLRLRTRDEAQPRFKSARAKTTASSGSEGALMPTTSSSRGRMTTASTSTRASKEPFSTSSFFRIRKVGDNCFEISNQGDLYWSMPRTTPVIANATCIGSGPGGDKSKRERPQRGDARPDLE